MDTLLFQQLKKYNFGIQLYAQTILLFQKIYNATSKPLRKMQSTRQSPIYANFDETLSGVTCVRAFKKQSAFIAKNDRLVDDWQCVFYYSIIADR